MDEVFVRIATDRGTLQEIGDRFSFFATNYKHMPKFKSGIWDGRIKLLDFRTNLLPIGLVEDLIEWMKLVGYEYEIDPDIFIDRKITLDQVNKFIDALNVPAKFQRRDYQVEAFRHALSRKRSGFLSPTSSGKSFIIYLITQFMLKNEKETLIIVPTINLVQQMNGDFADYNHNTFLPTHLITAGIDKSVQKPITISTWQSIMNQPKKWFDRFDCVMIDEVHGAEAKELTKIIKYLDHCPYRFGFTGTLRDTISNQMTLEGHFGRFSVVTTIEELEAAGYISKLNIKITLLKYSEEEKKIIRNLKTVKKGDKVSMQSLGAKAYADEMNFLDQHQKRNEFIVKYANSLKGNVLLLFKRVDKHGKILYEMLKEGCPEADVRYIHGGVDATDRETIRKLVDTSEKKVIIAGSLGTMSTGVSMNKIRHVIFVASTKANVTVMQSIGRGLRLDGGENLVTLHDLSDDFRHSHFVNSSIKHLLLRLEMYDKEKFEHEITSYKL